MSDTTPTDRRRRVQVAMDTSPLATLAVEIAAFLAADLNSDLEGFFCEDTQLLKLSGLPFVRETGAISAANRPLDPCEMERRLKAKADEVRRALAHQCSERQLTWSLTVVRERAVRHALKSVHDVDWLVIGSESRQPRASLLWGEGQRSKHPTVVVFDGSEPSRRALEMGQRSTSRNGHLVVLLLADTDDLARRFGNEALLTAPDAQLHVIRSQSVSEIAQVVQTHRGEMLIMPWELSISDMSTMEQLIDNVDCLVVLVR